MIKEVNLLLKEYLLTQLGNPSDTDLDFSFKLPSKEWQTASNTSDNWINIYLLEIKENLGLRRNSWQRQDRVNNSIETIKSPLFADLYYLITFYNKDKKSEVEHTYLESVLLSLYDFKNLSSSNQNLNKAILDNISLELFPKPFIDENISYQLWSSLNQDARPYIPLKVTVPLESKINKNEEVVREEGKVINLEVKPFKEESENN